MSLSNETKTDISFGELPAILMPGTPEYQSSLELLYGKKGLPEGFQPVVDMLGRKIEEQDRMPVKRGFLDMKKGERSVLVMKDHTLDFPELDLCVKVLGPPWDTRGFPALFVRSYCKGVENIEDADFVVFTGGPDVNPEYYHEKPYKYQGDEERDYSDIVAYMTCLDQGIPMVGVCRGAQFLAVMNGASLAQDIDGHTGDHSMYDVKNKQWLDKVSSIHHQCVLPCPGMEVLGYTNMSTFKDLNETKRIVSKGPDVEAFFFRDTCCFGVQGHPEYKDYPYFSKWFLDRINDLIILNEDLEWVDKKKRLKSEFLTERQIAKPEIKTKPQLTMIKGDK